MIIRLQFLDCWDNSCQSLAIILHAMIRPMSVAEECTQYAYLSLMKYAQYYLSSVIAGVRMNYTGQVILASRIFITIV